jgi:hypothetical protein
LGRRRKGRVVADLVARYYDVDTEPRYSLPALDKGWVTVRSILVEDLQVTGRTVAGEFLSEVCDCLVRRWLASKGDYTNTRKTWDPLYIDTDYSIRDVHEGRVEAVRGILLDYIDTPWTLPVIGSVAGHLVGWAAELKAGIRLRKWEPSRPVWAPLYIRTCERTVSFQGKRQYSVDVISSAGPTSNMNWRFNASPARLQMLMREAGLPRYEEFGNDDLGGLFLTALVYEHKRRMQFSDWHVSSSQRTRNKNIYKARSRGCIGHYAPFRGKACATCPIGRDVCPLSRIHIGYDIKKQCVNRHLGYFKKVSDGYCFLCYLEGKAKKENR